MSNATSVAFGDQQTHSELGKSPESGFKFKALGVTWDDLNVIGAGGMRLNIRTVGPSILRQDSLGLS